jgi:hypothetical protein
MDQKKKKKQPNKWLALINIPIQMGIIIFLFSFFGRWLDQKFSNSSELYIKIFVNQLNKND